MIVAIGLTLVLQGLNTSKMSAAQTHNRKVARELALLTLGEIEAGLYWEDLNSSSDILAGTYAEAGYEDWRYEVVLGDESFVESTGEYDSAYHDSWIAEREREARARDDEDDEDEDAEESTEPFEKVRIKVVYPKLGDRPNELVLERWIPWNLVYGSPDDEQQDKKSAEGESEEEESE